MSIQSIYFFLRELNLPSHQKGESFDCSKDDFPDKFGKKLQPTAFRYILLHKRIGNIPTTRCECFVE